ncbi:MAG: YdiU family protein [SAR86 cluster bacterium]|nr:YdiU family protein [SAR86 cluster bacterium]
MKLSNSYIGLPEEFYQVIKPVPVKSPQLLAFNQELVEELGLEIGPKQAIQYFSGNSVPENTIPIALNYAGHQFGNFVHELGDGRATLIGEIEVGKERFDIQLKGSGPTKFSRQGDGRSALGPVIREYIISEAMHHLKIPTTRALAAVSTGEHVFREQIEPGGILTRIAKSHIRVGTFEYFASRQQWEDVKHLADYTIQRHFPEIRELDNHYLELLKAVSRKQAKLIAKWMSVGFIHGVMNTDNFTISGETLDYGPCAFIDEYDPATVYSSIDHGGRYAFGNQPSIAAWNLASLAGCLISLINNDSKIANELATKVLDDFSINTNQEILDIMCHKIGLDGNSEQHQIILKDLLKIMIPNQADYTLSFRYLSQALLNKDSLFLDQFKEQGKIKEWLKNWKLAIKELNKDTGEIVSNMESINPVYIPRNHNVDKAIKASYEEDLNPMNELLDALKDPFEENEKYLHLALPPKDEEKILQTFCGT